MQEIIDFIVKVNCSQIRIEHVNNNYIVMADFANGIGETLEEAFKNWHKKYQQKQNEYLPIRDRKIVNTLEQF